MKGNDRRKRDTAMGRNRERQPWEGGGGIRGKDVTRERGGEGCGETFMSEEKRIGKCLVKARRGIEGGKKIERYA